MTRAKYMTVLAAIWMLWTSWASAAGAEAASAGQTEVVALGAKDSGYSLHIPGYIRKVTVEGRGGGGERYQTEAIMMAKPQASADGTYPLFEIATTDPAAHTLDAYPGIYGKGQMASFTRSFADGKVTYSVNAEFMDKISDQVFEFPFMVLDKQGRFVTDFLDIVVVFAGGAKLKLPDPNTAVSARLAASVVTVNGRTVDFEAYKIDGSHYFKLRDLAMALNGSQKRFEVEWDEDLNAIKLLTGRAYTPVGNELSASGGEASRTGKLSSSDLYLNGKRIWLEAYKIGGHNYVKLRDIASAIDFGVLWDPASATVSIDTSRGY